MADRCMVCGKEERDWKRVNANTRKRFTKAALHFRTMRTIYHDKDHPARDAASGAIVEAWRACKAEVLGEPVAGEVDLFSR
jgi:hypothetical protein